ncbi:hypothetical protein DFR31_0115 [Alkalispirillum mobile]|uniref:DUF2288 domain-containing protein n=1 Tax=Alkalispirillum mobile TaxID=85925 RepID=A0A498C3J4_9GAMM|nr:DUF2288 domain-containing protein [Alkalispirillum mobile]RLK50225.1 hypothetical protein DFR31_0115 [Alkalispirillum mobile]
MASENPDPRSLLNTETARIGWSELERHFASGAMVTVAPDLDLVEVGARFIEDDKPAVQQWLDNDRIRRTTEDEARRWAASDAGLWCVVVAPWVLVQEPQ